MEDHSSKITLPNQGQVGLVCTFGGQGFEYLQELRLVYENTTVSADQKHVSNTLLQKLLLHANDVLINQANSLDARSLGFYKEGFNIIDWINDEDVSPSETYLSSSPISYPLIFLTQVCQYAKTALSLFPSEKFDPISKMKEIWKGTTGHSQGIISSILVSVASNTQQYLSLSMDLLKYSFWIGARFQQVYDNQYLKVGDHDGEENPMLSILGLPLDVLDKVLTSVNKTIHPDYHLELSLMNGPRNFVCTGRPDVLKLLQTSLIPYQSKGEDQSRIPYSKRKYEFKMSYLSTSVAFHNSKMMNLVNNLVAQDLTRLKLSTIVSQTDLKIPVYSTFDGSNLATKKDSNSLMEVLTALMATKPVNWEKCLKEINNDNGITHVVDFGCGPSCLLVARVKEGRGIKVIQANSTDQDNYEEDHVLPKSYLSSLATTPIAENWKQFLPKLVKVGDKLFLDTKLTRITGKPPIIVAGMTPTTANEQIVIAFTNAGYQGEFAGGGQARPEIFRNRIKNIVDMISPDSGNGINVNILYLNQRLWNFQYPMCIEMKREGVPIDSITVAAGVPTLEKANQMIQEMMAVGMKYISFKPGSIQAIKDVVTIAQQNPNMNVVVQWTGGRAGGHHSFEDTHDPIIRTYSLLRSCPNIALIIGGGIGSAEDSMKYLNGTWCQEHYYGSKYMNNYAANDIVMPFDGILLGTRVMATKEALTSLAVKQLLVSSEGIHLMNERDWEKSYEQPVGGCLTIISELNEPIHVIANRCALLWKEFDTKFFSHHIQVQEKEFANPKTQEYIITRLNRDYQKLYFGKISDKNEIIHLYEMSYYEIAKRFIELTFIHGQFVHNSYRDRLVTFLQRIEERFYLESRGSKDLPKKVDSNLTFDSLIGESNIEKLNSNPMEVVEEVTSKYLGSRSQIIITEDVDFFLHMCKDSSFGKPVNFIPIIDKDFSVYFKKDSLWYSESLEVVKDEDPQRVMILASPVSVHYIKQLNEPIADLLNHFNSHLIQEVTNTFYGGNSNHSSLLKVEYIGGSPIESVRSEEISGLSIETSTSKNIKITTLRLSKIDADVHKWTEFLAGNMYSWWRALLTSPHVIHYSKYKVANYFQTIFKPRSDVDKIELVEDNGQLVSVKLFSKTFTQIQKDEKLPEISVNLIEKSNIRVEFNHIKSNECVQLCLDYSYNPERGHSPISLKSNSSKYNELIKEFYAKLWIQTEFKELSVKNTFTATKKLNKTQFDDFLKSIRRPSILNTGNNPNTPVAVDLAVVFAWEALSSTLFVKEVDSSLFQLLHLTYGYKILSTDLDVVNEGDSITSKIHVTEIVNTTTGKRVTALGYLYKNDKSTPIIEVTSQFFFRGNYVDHQNSFKVKRTKKIVPIQDKLMKEIVESRKWIQFNSVHSKKSQIPTPVQIGDTLIFDLESTYYYSSFEGENFSRILTRGLVEVTRGGEDSRTIANIELESKNSSKDVVESFLERHGKNVDNVGIFENGGYIVVDNVDIPSPSVVDSELYARASGDYNPIHYNSSLALFSGLDSTITHGMWTAAMGRNFIETSLQLGSTGDKNVASYKVKSYQVNFMEKVLPEQRLRAKLSHVGMKNGLKLVELVIINDQDAIVMKASAEVEAGNTAYVFTGQGSAEINMGMDLYESSEIAKNIWDRAEAYMLNNYGFSLMKIVKQNPKEITINFQSEKGSKIRAKYMSLKHTHKTKDGSSIMVPLFPDITDNTETYTFDHPQGLLYQTQFQQPALTLVEKAAFDDMKYRGYVHNDSIFAGHSLGEYSALASVANILSVEDLVELVFIRGITMQNCVKRNQHGLSNFGMVAVNPTRVSSTFNIDHLHKLVDLISEISKRLLQVVNYNVYNWQFVVSGHNSNLETLRIVLNKIKENPKLMSKELDSQLIDLVTKTLALYPNEDENELDEYSIVTLQQGTASIPLLGIDVPFHSKYLLPEVPQFRNYLLKTLDYKNLNIDLLEDKYVPNLTAEPFKISLEYANSIIQVTNGASILSEIIKSRSFDLSKNEDKRLLGYFILVELLAFQFASPVLWIPTQQYIFKKGVQRLIEIGPSTTLTQMAKRSLQIAAVASNGSYSLFPHKDILSFKTDKDAIYYNIIQTPVVPKPKKVSKKKQVEQETKKEVAPIASSAPTPALLPVSAPVSSGTKSTIPHLTSTDVIKVLLALKLKKQMNEIQDEQSIKDLVGGKSAIQNEIVGDLQKEFGSEPEHAGTLSIVQLAAALTGSATAHKKLNTHSIQFVSKFISNKLAAGFGMSQVKEFLTKEHALDENQIEAVLFYGLTMEPSSRLEDINKSKEFLTSAGQAWAAVRGGSFVSTSKSGGTGGSGAVAMVDSEALKAVQQKQDKMIRHVIEVYNQYLGEDSFKSINTAKLEASLRKAVENDISVNISELGTSFLDGIKPKFDPLFIRRYNSSWAWGREEAFRLFYDTILDNPAFYDSVYCNRVQSLINRASQELLEVVQQITKKAFLMDNIRVAKHIEALSNQIKEHIHTPSVFKIITSTHLAPFTAVTSEGKIIYKEVERTGVSNFIDFIKEMKHGSPPPATGSNTGNGRQTKRHVRRISNGGNGTPTLCATTSPVNTGTIGKKNPHIHLKYGRDATSYNSNLTHLYYKGFEQIVVEGISFQGKTALVTGCNRGSIGLEIIKPLLQGGAKVICTTSNKDPQVYKNTTDMYNEVYKEFGGKDSELIVLPFNQGSNQDVNSLIEYIYDKKNGLGETFKDIDYFIPFGAISEAGRDISNIDSLSELSHRIMLTNVIRLVGKIKSMKEKLNIETKPTTVILPLSPNIGIFGGDGLYAESKLGLETLFYKWESENWSNYINIIGAVIGWTRGTGLMNDNNIVSHGVEKMLNMRTFNQQEMAYSIVALLHSNVIQKATKPIWADITGGMKSVADLNTIIGAIRSELMLKADINRSIHSENKTEGELQVVKTSKSRYLTKLRPRVNYQYLSKPFPELPTSEQLKKHEHLQGMVDLEKVVVISGYGEVGPFGGRRTRWDVEASGEFSVEGCIEMAWYLGLIKYHSGVLATNNGMFYNGWVHATNNTPVNDVDIKSIYEADILKQCGIREMEVGAMGGYSPHQKGFLHEVAVHQDLQPMEVSNQDAERFKLEHGDKVDIFTDEEGKTFARFKKGAVLWIPKSMKYNRFVAGQIPTSWDPLRYGIPKDIVDQVDRVTLFNLVSTCESLYCAGIRDPYEFYQYVSLKEVGNCSGSGIGGVSAIRKTFRERAEERNVQSDILQETFINVIPAWINMLLLSSCGPLKIPVGACATSAVSVELGVDTIMSGKAGIVFVGGVDDIGEESSYEFGQMKATNESEKDVKHGRVPSQHSRPATDTRAGFIEAHGSATQILARADIALAMGLPVFGIIGFTNTSSDKLGRSVPAPGRGILSTASEHHDPISDPLLDIHYRRYQLDFERKMIQQWKELQLANTSHHVTPAFIEAQAKRKEKAAMSLWGNDFYVHNPNISLMRGSLAVWGLTADDISAISFHGTSTNANDKNEGEVINSQMQHLGRSKGNPMFTIFQKYLTGHSKGAAAGWMINGLLDAMNDGVVPGNRNMDNVDNYFQKFEHLLYTSKSIRVVPPKQSITYKSGLSSVLLTSFGFGQASAEMLLIHPNFLFATLPSDRLEEYKNRRSLREKSIYLHEMKILFGKGGATLVSVKNEAPYDQESETAVLLDPLVRATYDETANTWKLKTSGSKSATSSTPIKIEIPKVDETKAPSEKEKSPTKASAAASLEVMVRQFAKNLRQPTDRGIGVDIQTVAQLNLDDSNFLQRNYTDLEIKYCTASKEDARDKLAGRWAAKEAVIKAITNSISEKDLHASQALSLWKGSAASLKGIEILPSELGYPIVKLHDHALNVCKILGIQESNIKLSISHSGDYAIAQAVVQ